MLEDAPIQPPKREPILVKNLQLTPAGLDYFRQLWLGTRGFSADEAKQLTSLKRIVEDKVDADR